MNLLEKYHAVRSAIDDVGNYFLADYESYDGFDIEVREDGLYINIHISSESACECCSYDFRTETLTAEEFDECYHQMVGGKNDY